MKFKKLFSRRHRNKPRTNAFVLEWLDTRLLLSAAPMTASVVTTDHVDYAPGETAVIITSNTNGDGLQFSDGELVRFQVTRTDGMAVAAGTTSAVGPTGNEAWYVTDGVWGFSAHRGSDVSGDGMADWIAPDNDPTVNSSISTTWFVEEQYRNSSLLVTAAGQESGAVASQAFTDAAENTTTTITSSGAPSVVFPGSFESTYGDAVTFTATVTAAVGVNGHPSGTVEFYNGATLLGTSSGESPAGPNSYIFSLTIDTLSASDFLQGNHAQISAKYISNNNSDTGWNDSTSGTIRQIVYQREITGFLTVADKVYDGTTAATETSRGLNGVLARDAGNVVLTNGPDDNSVVPNGGPARFQSANADTNSAAYLWHVALTGSAANNYRLHDYNIGTVAHIFQKEVTGTFLAANKVYDGTTAATVQGGTLSGTIAGDDVNLGAATATFDTANVGIGKTVTLTGATLVGTAASNYKLTSLVKATTIVSTKAKAIAGSFTVAEKVYDGTTTATVLTRGLTGVVGTDDVQLNGGTATFDTANAGIGKTVTLTGATLIGTSASNYTLALPITATGNIAKAGATVNVLGYTGTYDAAAHGATGTATGVGGVNLSGGLSLGASFTNAPGGTANWTFSGGTNYNDQSGSVAIVINKANATISVTGYLVTYDAAAHGATGTATGVGGVNLSGGLSLGASFTNAPGGTANWSFTGGTNYNNQSGSVAIEIAKANATVNVPGYSETYDG